MLQAHGPGPPGECGKVSRCEEAVTIRKDCEHRVVVRDDRPQMHRDRGEQMSGDQAVYDLLPHAPIVDLSREDEQADATVRAKHDQCPINPERHIVKGKRDEKPQDLGNGPAGVNNRNDPSEGIAIGIEQPVVLVRARLAALWTNEHLRR